MTRKLHQQDVCTLVSGSLHTELTELITDDACVIAAQDRRLEPVLPINGQQTLSDSQLSLPTGTQLCTAPYHRSDVDQQSHLPHTSTERFHFQTNQFTTVLLLCAKCGYFQRGPPFLDSTRITEPGGTVVSVTGLQPLSSPDHDAKWWVPNSADATLDSIRVLRSEDSQTPIPISIFSITGTTNRRPEATIVSKPDTTQTI